tara:strand:+ start:8211 stop:8954 length:744 start_codon:yes stop_codon:yes gene_type:complete
MLNKKNTLITGCNRGIGKALLEKFIANGSDIIACVRKSNHVFEKYCKKLRKKYKKEIVIIEIDFKKNNIEKEVEAKIKEIKKIDILINNAGQNFNSIFLMTNEKDFEDQFKVNFLSQTQLTKVILKKMISKKKGTIINISSSVTRDFNQGRVAYTSSKAAMNSLTAILSKEVGRFNIRVNAIAPGLTKTRMFSTNFKNKQDENDILNRISLGRFGNSNDIANCALFLASDDSSYITGQTIFVDGGLH